MSVIPSSSPASATPNPATQSADPGKTQAAADPKTDPTSAADQDRASRHFAALAKREKQILERERMLREKDTKYADIEAREKRYREDPLSLLKEFGHDLDGVVKRAANGGKLTAEQQAELALKEIDAMRREQAEDKKKQEEAAEKKRIDDIAAQESAAVANFKKGALDFVMEKKDQFPVIAIHPEPDELIYSTIDKHYAETGKIMDYEEAVTHAEKTLEDSMVEEMQKLLAIDKIKSRVLGTEAKAAPKAAPGSPPVAPPKTLADALEQKEESVTLSNDLSTKGPAPSERLSKNSSIMEQIEESKKKAASHLRWKTT